MEKKKIYYKYAFGKDGIKLLEKEGGTNLCGMACLSYEMYYIPFCGGIMRCTADMNGDIAKYVKANGIEIKPKEILNDVERRYISNICRPFMDKVTSVTKKVSIKNCEYIRIEYLDFGCYVYMPLPNFKKGTMYKGMQLGIKYTPKELKLK